MAGCISIPKPCRLRDVKAIQAARKSFSELSGLPAHGEPHHIIPRSVGGPDHAWNLIQLTAFEHRKAQDGMIPAKALFEIVARREGVDVDILIREVNRMRGRYSAD